MKCRIWIVALLAIVMTGVQANAQTTASVGIAGRSGENDLVIAQDGTTRATVVVDVEAGPVEKEAAADLVKYIEMMTGAKPALANAAPAGNDPVILVGSAALKADASLQKALDNVAKKDPLLRADAMATRRVGNRVFLAATNDEAQYYPVSSLLQQWGCRWYMPIEFGEVVPEYSTLKVGQLNFTYAPPFEVRAYWNAWNGSGLGQKEFMLRNYMNTLSVSGGHAIGELTKELAPPGGSVFNVPIAEEATAEHIAKKIAADYAAGKQISLGMEDGIYTSPSAKDKEVQAGIYDKGLR